MKTLDEYLPFLQLGTRSDLKSVAVNHISGLTADKCGLEEITGHSQILTSLLILTQDINTTVAEKCCSALVNISASEKGAKALIELKIDEEQLPAMIKCPDNIVTTMLKFIMDPNSTCADYGCMCLCNISRHSSLVGQVIEFTFNSGIRLDQIVNVFTKIKYNKKEATLDYLGPLFSNLSQSRVMREHILDRDKCIIQQLLPFTEYKESTIRRRGIIATLKNCCFEQEYHSWLLNEDVDILPRLLIPLAGNKQFDDEDNEKLPIELQYLPEDKVREEDPDIRCMLIEAITQLCATRDCREYIRDKNTYIILRELHIWEKNKDVLRACENLVDILIRTEEEIGVDNFRDVDIPDEALEKIKILED